MKDTADKKAGLTELLLMGVIASRSALQAQIAGLKLNPLTIRFAEEMQRSVDVLDYATSAIAAEIDWPVAPGAGATMPPHLAERVAKWIARGRIDRF